MGSKIELDDEVVQTEIPDPYTFPPEKQVKIDMEIQKLEAKGVIRKTKPEPGQYLSPIFTRDKRDGSFRIILDLSEFNELVVYRHFKMDKNAKPTETE